MAPLGQHPAEHGSAVPGVVGAGVEVALQAPVVVRVLLSELGDPLLQLQLAADLGSDRGQRAVPGEPVEGQLEGDEGGRAGGPPVEELGGRVEASRLARLGSGEERNQPLLHQVYGGV